MSVITGSYDFSVCAYLLHIRRAGFVLVELTGLFPDNVLGLNAYARAP